MIGPRGENLIFAISQPRAGSTLLQRMLAGHPSIFATAEPWIMLHPLYALRAQGHTADYNAEWARAALKDFCDNLEGGEQAYVEALRAMGVSLYNQALQRSGRACFLDKTPRYYQICPELRRTFPEAKFILLLRNPLAVLSSMLTSWIQEDWERLELYQEDLLTAPPRLEAALRGFGSDAILVRYEEMVQQPEQVMGDLCGRLGLPFDPGMIEYGGRPKPKGNMGDDVGIHRFSRPVTESKDKWLAELAAPRRRLLAESYLAALDHGVLSRLGYPKQELLSALRAIPVSPSPDPLPAEAHEHAAKLFRLPPATVAAAARCVQQKDNPAAVALFMNGAPASRAPLVSVIVSVHAAERYLRACLEDLVAQTIFDQTEILVIDSGSPENEGAIVKEFQRRHKNIHYHRTERETLYAAWNRAIGLARGKYIANANADDAHRADALELLVAALEAHPAADLAYGDYYTSSVPNDTFAQPHILRHVMHPPYHPATVMMYCVTGCHPLWRRTIFNEVGLFDPSFTAPGDYEFLLRFVQAGRRAVHVPQPISLFYQNPDGLSWKSAAQTKNEGDRILGQHRTGMPIERIFKADPADPRSLARAWTALGNVALQHEMPWFSNYIQAVPYARMCYERALQLDPDCAAAKENLVIVHLLQPGQAATPAALLNTLPSERAKVVGGDLASGQLRPVRADVPPAVEPLEFGSAPGPQAALVSEPAVLPDAGIASATSPEAASEDVQPAQAEARWSVRLAAPFLNRSELAAEARSLALPLMSKVQLTTYDLSEHYSASLDAALPVSVREALRVSRVGFNLATGGIGICMQVPNGLSRLQGARYHVGRTAFEADRVREETARLCNQFDELWVPSRSTADAFLAGGVEAGKILVLPPGVDVSEFNPERSKPRALPHRAAWNFLASFDWQTRKGWDVLVTAYLHEFSAQDDVCLYLQTGVGDRPEREARVLIERQLQEFLARLSLAFDGAQAKSRPRIELLLEPIPPHEQPSLYRAVDCVVCPSRGESWNRTAHEAMAMALPVIATRWGGHLDLVTEETGYLLDCETVPASRLDLTEWAYHGARWAEPSVAHLRELLRRVQRQPAEARERGVQARARVVQLFSNEVS
ncbi:MAG TPA: sulfotransferase, partial [Candidatus Saccharimonadales bacterium]|nr:sulfotransferase [Candidatus Saccharimonadales bacterium]